VDFTDSLSLLAWRVGVKSLVKLEAYTYITVTGVCGQLLAGSTGKASGQGGRRVRR